MRTTILLATVATATLMAGSAEARGRIRFHFPWSSRAPAAKAVEARPPGEARSGGIMLIPLLGRTNADRREENTATAAVPSAMPVVAAAPKPKPPVPAIEAKAAPCPASGLFGAGAGFCAVN